MIMIDILYQKIRRLYNDFLHFSDFGKTFSILGLILFLICLFFVIQKYLFWVLIVLLVGHSNTILSIVEKYGHGKYDVYHKPANGSVTKLLLNDKDIIIDSYNE